jgi:RNA polymerase sigma-70 factor (ECF subfamily)
VDDDDIRVALRRGDTNVAFRLVVRAHGPAVYAACCRILKDRDAAEDVMQQAMMAAFKSRSQLLEVDQIRGWLIRTASRKCIDVLRSSKRTDRLHRERLNADIADTMDGGDVLELLGTTQEHRALEACLAALAPEVAAAVLMRYREKMSWEQIAEAVAMPLDTIRMRVQRGAINSLRKCLESKGFAP